MENLVKVIIPIYSATISPLEKLSLERAYVVLGRYRIVVVKPRSLDLQFLLSEFPALTFESFDDSYFVSIRGYNRLMMTGEFYQRFLDCKYILICQLDTYIFSDRLGEWCATDYDYIGAPWLVRPVYRFPLFVFTSWLKKKYCTLLDRPNSQITNFKVGNGGLSLRKVSSHLQATIALSEVVEKFLSYGKNHIFNEDVFFSIEVNKHGLGFKYPDYMEALQFSFDKYPALCYRLNDNRLPFGCHSWYKKKMKSFWFPIIKPEC
ncbi:MAG: DUF5672 family protein [Mucinivorans sp.]